MHQKTQGFNTLIYFQATILTNTILHNYCYQKIKAAPNTLYTGQL